MAVSVLFSRLQEFNPNGCNKTEYAPLPLANAGMVWTYPGHGPQTLGNSDPFEIRYIGIDQLKHVPQFLKIIITYRLCNKL